MTEALPFIEYVKKTLDSCTWAITPEEKESKFKQIYKAMNELYLKPYTPKLIPELFHGDFEEVDNGDIKQTMRSLNSQDVVCRLFYQRGCKTIDEMISLYQHDDCSMYWNDEIEKKYFN